MGRTWVWEVKGFVWFFFQIYEKTGEVSDEVERAEEDMR